MALINIKYNDATVAITIQYTDGSLPTVPLLGDPQVLSLLAKLKAMNVAVPLANLHFHQTSPGHYSFTWMSKDTRLWTENYIFTGLFTNEAFNVTGSFSLTELIPNRDLRLTLGDFYHNTGMDNLAKIDAVWV